MKEERRELEFTIDSSLLLEGWNDADRVTFLFVTTTDFLLDLPLEEFCDDCWEKVEQLLPSTLPPFVAGGFAPGGIGAGLGACLLVT